MRPLHALVLTALLLATPSAAQTAADSIGVATMSASGVVTLRLRASGPTGTTGEGTLTYGPDNPEYRAVLRHLGGLQPGQSKPVLPWPDEPPEPRSRR